MKKLTILAVDQGEHLGGAERFFADLLSHLEPERYDLHVVTAGGPGYRSLYSPSVTFHAADLPTLKPIGLRSSLRLKKAQRMFSQLLENIQPDLVVSNTVRTHILTSGPTTKVNLPLIWMAHDMTFPKPLIKWFGKYPDHVICCSEATRDFYTSANPKLKSKSSVLYPFGIESEDLNEMKKVERQPIIGMVGKFIPWKGQHVFLEAVQQLRDEVPEYRFVLVGDAYTGNAESETYLRECLQYIEQQNLQEVVELKSHIPNLYDELATWDMQVHCSLEPEPLGRVILEGMAAENVMIVSNQGGPTEIVKHEQTGLLISPTVDEMVTALKRCHQDSQLKDTLRQNASEYIEKTFPWERVIEAFESTLKNSQRRSKE